MKRYGKLAAVVLMLAVCMGAVGTSVDFVRWSPIKHTTPSGIVTGYGVLSTASARATKAKAVIEAAAAGDCIDLGESSYAATASVTIPAGVYVKGGANWAATGLTDPAFIVAANDITIDGLRISSNTTCIGAHTGGTPITATGLKLRNLVVTTTTNNVSAAAWTDNATTSGGAQNTITAAIENCRFNATTSGIGIKACLSSTSVIRVSGGYATGGADGCYWAGHADAQVYMDGGTYESDIDGITTGGPDLYLFGGLRARGGQQDIYSDGGQIFAADIDIVTPGESGITYTQTYHGITPTANVLSLWGAADYAAMRTLLGLAIGTNVQAYDADLTTWAGVTPGTGVATAAGNAVNAAGGFVTHGGNIGAATATSVALGSTAIQQVSGDLQLRAANISCRTAAGDLRVYFDTAQAGFYMGQSANLFAGNIRAGVMQVGSSTSVGGTHRFIPRSPAQITSNQHNYAPGGDSKYLRLSTDASRDITGLTFASAQVDGEEHVIINVGSNNIVLKHDVTSTAANRFLNSTGADITLAANEAADLMYDGTTQRWRVLKR